MSRSVAKGLGELRRSLGEVGVVVRPGRAVPDLEAVADAGDHDLAADARVLQEARRQHHATGGVELRLQGGSVDESPCLARLPGQRIREAREGLVRHRRIGLCRIEADDLLDRSREIDALAQLCPELRRNREPILGVEVVFEGAGEGQGAWSVAKREESWSVDPGWRSGRSPATRERLREFKVPHFVPLCNTEPAQRPTFRTWCEKSPHFAGFYPMTGFVRELHG